jgi:hypothetical protein
MGTIYCGPFAAEIDEGTRYGHEGYASQILPDGSTARFWVRPQLCRAHVAECACGWRSSREHEPTRAGEDAALEEWDRGHLQPLIRAVAARRVVPATAVLDQMDAIRSHLRERLAARAGTPEEVRDEYGPALTDRELGWCDVLDTLPDWLEEAAVLGTAGAGMEVR